MPKHHQPPTIPLLLTSSIVAHDPGVQLKNTDARLHHALESIEQWLKLEPNLPIVLCDGSNFDLTPHVREKFPHTKIECLFFANNTGDVVRYGRGYGEGEIVRFALEHSRLIREADCFAKCTSKLWVENFCECKKQWNGHLLLKGVFSDVFSLFKVTQLAYIDTRFYIASCTTYREYFIDAHKHLRLDIGYGLEDSFKDIFQQQDLKNSLLPIPPVINGVGGGTGTYYKNPARRIVKEKIRLYLAMHNTKFRTLFSKGYIG